MSRPRTLFDKIWESHLVDEQDDGTCLLYIDRHLVHEVTEGVCIARRNRGINSSFTVRKISYGEGVERVFPLYSPRVDEIEVVRRGRVRRAKLYYLRGRAGKRARIAEKTTGVAGKIAALERAEASKAKGKKKAKSS